MIDFTQLTFKEIILAILIGLMVYVAIEMQIVDKKKTNFFKKWLKDK